MCPNIKNSPSSQAGPPKKMNGVPEPGSWDEATTGIPQPRKKTPLTRMKDNYLKNATVAIFQQPELLYLPDPPLGLRSFVETMWSVEPLPRASYSDKTKKKRSCPLPLTLSYCNNACCATMQNESVMGEPYMGGAWGGYRSSSCHQGNWGGIAL